MRVFELDEIVAACDEATALAAVEQALIAYGAGRAQIGDAGDFTFDAADGDCHVKAGYVFGDDIFVVKVASDFRRNPQAGLPVAQGFVAVVSATTGEPLAILRDGGHLTALRTAMAGVLAARAIGFASGTLGVVGTGTQARLQADFIARHLGAARVLVWGRDSARAAALAADVGGTACALEDLVRQSDLIVTTTSSTTPLVCDAWVRPGMRIIAVGADGGGKRELEATLLGRATVVVDAAQRCLDDGEAGCGVRGGHLDPATLVDLGTLLAAPPVFADDAVVVVDLTGLAVQDSAIGGTVWRALSRGAGVA